MLGLLYRLAACIHFVFIILNTLFCCLLAGPQISETDSPKYIWMNQVADSTVVINGNSYKEGKTTDLMCHSSDDNMVVLKTVITRALRVIVGGGRVLRMGQGPTNSYVDSRAKCDVEKK